MVFVFYLYFLVEVEDALPSDHDFYDAPNLVLSLKHKDIALDNGPDVSESCKLEPNKQEDCFPKS